MDKKEMIRMINKIEKLNTEMEVLKKEKKQKIINKRVNKIMSKLIEFSHLYDGSLDLEAGNIIDGIDNIIRKEIYKLLKDLKKGVKEND